MEFEMKRIVFFALLSVMAACTSTIQTSSGADWLASRGTVTDAGIATAAALEPDWFLPANIGVARVVNNRITALPDREAHALGNITLPDGVSIRLIPISPLIVQNLDIERGTTALRIARLAAARQHLDYVLVYDLSASGRGIATTGRAEAILLDVRNGYPYGTASAQIKTAGTLRDRASGRYRALRLNDPSALRATQALSADLQGMIGDLATQDP